MSAATTGVPAALDPGGSRDQGAAASPADQPGVPGAPSPVLDRAATA